MPVPDALRLPRPMQHVLQLATAALERVPHEAPATDEAAPPPGSARFAWLRGRGLYIAIFVVVFAVWTPAIKNGLVQDDYVSVLLSPGRWELESFREYFLPTRVPDATPYLRPLPPLSFHADQVLFGADRAGAWHLTSIGLHALNAVLLAAVLRRPFGTAAALAAALVFGFHPVHTESVGWITARFDLMAATFLLSSVLLFARRRVGFSALAFALALLSKETAVMLPFLLTAYLLWRRRGAREVAWHWVILAAYVAYRWVALSGPGIAPNWAPDVGGWFLKPWAALVFPLPGSAGGWSLTSGLPDVVWWAGAAMCAVIVLIVLRRPARTLALVLAVMLALLPAIAVFQLGPNFEFGRYLYVSAAVWSVAIGLAFRAPTRTAQVVLGLYLAVLLAAGVSPRAKFQQVGATGKAVVEATKDVLGMPAPDASIVAYGVPLRVNGWIVFGDHLGVALNRAYGYLDAPPGAGLDVLNVGWEREVGRAAPPPGTGDIVLRWDRDTASMAACANAESAVLHSLERLEHPCPPEAALSRLDFGTEDLFLYRSRGFRWNESDGRETWNWMVEPKAELALPLDVDGHERILLRVASVADNTLTVRVNGESVGTVELREGFAWQDAAVFVPGRVWKPGPYQTISFEARASDADRYVAVAEVAFEPVESVAEVDIGDVMPGHYRAEGFSPGERDAGVTWSWAVTPDASLDVPLEAPGDRRMLLRLMSAVDNEVQVSVNGIHVGRAEVPGDLAWRETALYVPERVWRADPAQHIRFEAADGVNGRFFALDRLTISPVSAIESLDFGRGNLALYQPDGFAENATDGQAVWTWVDGRSAALELPLEASSGRELRFHLMAVDDVQVKVLVNGGEVGLLALFGGFMWQDAAVPVPESAWREGPTQLVRLESVDPGRNLRVGIERLALSELRLVDGVDFGSESLALYQASGFRANEGEDGVTWNWVAQPEATLRLPLDVQGLHRRILLRVMSPVENTLRISVNGTHAGEVTVPGGFMWQAAAVYVPASAWADSPVQEVTLAAERNADGAYVALDWLRVGPIPVVEDIDFGSDNLGLYSASGFRAHESGRDGTTWNWMDSDSAALDLPVWIGGPFALSLRLMSAVDNSLSLSVNGIRVGEREIAGGFGWQSVTFHVPPAAWRDAPAQAVRLETARDADGLRAAIDRMSVLPIPDRIAFGSGAVERFGGRGFRWDESDGVDSWNWIVEPVAEIAVPVDTTIAKCLAMRLMSVDDTRVRIAVNDTAVGEVSVDGGTWWQWSNVGVPESAWVPGVMQMVSIEARDAEGPLYLAVERLIFSPSRIQPPTGAPLAPEACP